MVMPTAAPLAAHGRSVLRARSPGSWRTVAGDARLFSMGIYREQVLPRLIDRLLGTEEVGKDRSRTTPGLHGTIVEIGFGSGLNIEHYPDEVEKVYAVDPALLGRKLAADRVAASSAKVEYVGLDGAALPLGDESCDGALSTYTLCTIPDVAGAIKEVHRVLAPGARFHVLEHGLARDHSVATWQSRLNPIQNRLGDGCNLDRDHVALLTAGGFEIDEHEEWYGKGPKSLTALYRLLARKPG